MLARASAALAKCHDDSGVNPAATLAHVIGERAREGPRQADVRDAAGAREALGVGLWLEQLIAESTGKQGTGVLPVAGEPLGEPGGLRRRPALRPPPRTGTGYDDAGRRAQRPARGRAPGLHAAARRRPADIGALFVEWEIATALVGARLHINPFDQPNVQEAKDRTVAILERLRARRQAAGRGAGLARATCSAHAERGRSYVCLQAFVAPTPERQALLDRLQAPPARRARLRRHGRLRAALPALDRPVPQGRPAERRVRAAAGGRAGRRGDPRAGVRLPHPARRAGARRRRRAPRPRPARWRASPWPPARRRSSGRSSTSQPRGSAHEDRLRRTRAHGRRHDAPPARRRPRGARLEPLRGTARDAREPGRQARGVARGARREPRRGAPRGLGHGAVRATSPSRRSTHARRASCARATSSSTAATRTSRDGKRRSAALAERGIVFVDAGTSGGVWGYQVGYCLMVGGPDEAIAHLAPGAHGPRPARTAGCTAARPARATSSRWCTTASSTA